jgi:hypothetical protein
MQMPFTIDPLFEQLTLDQQIQRSFFDSSLLAIHNHHQPILQSDSLTLTLFHHSIIRYVLLSSLPISSIALKYVFFYGFGDMVGRRMFFTLWLFFVI